MNGTMRCLIAVSDWLCVKKMKKDRDNFPACAILKKRAKRVKSI